MPKMTMFDFKKRLGAGNFGEVWLAVNKALNSVCALKCIPPDRTPNALNFFQEAQFLKLAEHPNIVLVNEAGTLEDGRIYLSMEYLEKGSLEDETKGAFVKLTRARKIMCEVLRGLEYAHSKGIVHRDVKPANILIGHSLEGKLSDFGLARPRTIDTKETTTLKDYLYVLHLAPEVRTLPDYTHLSDIYSCGVTLYRLVNGDSYLPRMSEDLLAKIRKGKYPDRSKYRMFIPRSLRLIINKSMSVDPKERYQSAEAMRRALEKIKICINWDEQGLSEGTHWISGHKGCCYQVAMVKDKKELWNVIVQKGKSKKTLRIINRLSQKCSSEAKAIIATKKILQSFVNGDEK